LASESVNSSAFSRQRRFLPPLPPPVICAKIPLEKRNSQCQPRSEFLTLVVAPITFSSVCVCIYVKGGRQGPLFLTRVTAVRNGHPPLGSRVISRRLPMVALAGWRREARVGGGVHHNGSIFVAPHSIDGKDRAVQANVSEGGTERVCENMLGPLCHPSWRTSSPEC